MNVRKLSAGAALVALTAQLWYTFIDFHIYFPVSTCDVEHVISLFPPADVALYRSYVPETYEMPAEPMVKVDFVTVTPTWHEAFVSLRVRYRGEDGWYGVTWAIDSLGPYALGYWVGYPKFMADAMTLRRTSTGYSATVMSHEETFLAMQFVKGEANARPLDRQLVEDTAAYFNLMPPLRGPPVNRLANHMLVQSAPTYESGVVNITVNPKERWARLVTRGTERTEPGYFVTRGGRAFGFLVAHKLN